MKTTLTLTYDLSFTGDYTGLYKWLDSHNAIECGDSACLLTYDFKGIEKNDTEESTKKMLGMLRDDIKNSVKVGLNDRFYVCSDFFFKGALRFIGGFIIGKRKDAPWKGCNNTGDEEPKLDDESLN